MKAKTFKWLGMSISFIGLIIIAWNVISFIAGFQKLPEAVLILGLIMAAVGIWMNNKVLFGKK
jgi:hypothetical protein